MTAMTPAHAGLNKQGHHVTTPARLTGYIQPKVYSYDTS